MPLLSSGELGYHLKENALYIGTSMNARNVRLCGEDDVANINAQIEELRGLISGINAQIETLAVQTANITAQTQDINARLTALTNE